MGIKRSINRMGVVTTDGFWIGFIETLHTQIVTANDTALSIICTLYRSLGHTKTSQFTLVLSWQRIYNSLPLTSAYIMFSNHTLNRFYRFINSSPLKRA
jgi:hypothetical protein